VKKWKSEKVGALDFEFSIICQVISYVSGDFSKPNFSLFHFSTFALWLKNTVSCVFVANQHNFYHHSIYF
jgi:hypothetical protein